MSEIKKPRATVVTGYYVVKSKYDHKKSYFPWIQNFMTMDMQVVIYGNKLSIEMLSSEWPQSPNRIYIQRELDSFVTSKFNWSYDLTIDKEAPKRHSIPLYQIWNEKIFMVRDTIDKNPYNTKSFAWIDIGSFRDASKLKDFDGFPDPQRFNTSKVTFLQIYPFTDAERKNLDKIDSRFQFINRVGGLFAGGDSALRQFADLHEKIIGEAHSHKVLAGKDQSLYAFEILRHPELFDAVRCPKSDYDMWFAVHELWATNPNITYTDREKFPTKLSIYYYNIITVLVVLSVIFLYCNKRWRV